MALMPKMNEDINAVRYNLGMNACLFGAEISSHLAAAKCCDNDAIGQSKCGIFTHSAKQAILFPPPCRRTKQCLYS